MSEQTLIFTGSVVHCTGPFQLQALDQGYVIVQGSKILSIGVQSELESTKEKLNITTSKEVKLSNSQLLIPGLIDSHIHAPQYPNAGLGYDKPLLEWLDLYTYKLEKQYKDQDLSTKVYNAIVKKTLSCGTTTACYFASLFEDSSLILADAAVKHGQRALIGKINMTTLAPDDYVETPDETITNTLSFIEKIKSLKNDLILPIITPRFALSLDMETMRKLAAIAMEENLHIQSHISENKSEVQLITKTFRMGYTKVYEEANLLTSKTILAHGVHLEDNELDVLAKTGTSISHCPDSNTCLRSGLCDVKRLLQHGVTVGLGTDISGGMSTSIIQTMRAALQVSTHISFQQENYVPLDYKEVFYLATLGGAKALALEEKIGNFTVGKDFDALIIDANVENSTSDYLIDCDTLEILQKFIFLGDDRNVDQVYVAGRRVK